MLEAVGAPPLPESPVYRGNHNSKTAALARELILRERAAWVAGEVERAARLDRYARLLLACAQTDGWRCGLPICPRCECRKAKRYRTRMEARLRSPATFALVTLTLACDELKPGARMLLVLGAALRRRALWRRTVAGGELHLQVKPSEGGVRRWNLHLHAVVQLRDGARLDGRDLRVLWEKLLGRTGTRGSADVRTLTKHWAVYRDERQPEARLFVSKTAFYVTSRKPGHQLPALPPEALDEVLRFLRKQRRVSSFGSWRNARQHSDSNRKTERKSA